MALKTYYHGTVQAFLADIKKRGLIPMASHSWKIRFDHEGEMIPNPDVGSGVYLTDKKEHAERYAQTRADYFQRNPGECFEMYGPMYGVPDSKDSGVFLSKNETAPVLHTVPLLLTLELDSSKFHLQEDPEDRDNGSYVCQLPIPASAISEITKLPAKYSTDTFDKKRRQKVIAHEMDAMFGGKELSDYINEGIMAAAVKKHARD